MLERDVQVFIDGLTHYFKTVAKKKVEVGTPFLKESGHSVAREFNGVIDISGVRKGTVTFTAPRELLAELLTQVGGSEVNDDTLWDLVGEVANTLAGNARRSFGPDFSLAPPKIVNAFEHPELVPEPPGTFVVPIEWANNQGALLISLTQ